MTNKNIEKAYEIAKQRYQEIGIDTDNAIKQLANIPISMHCWQGDDVGGFESAGSELSGGGIQATGNYPGKAKTIDQLRGDIEMALGLIPGKHRLNIHACYLDNAGKKVERDQIGIEHFQSWIDWGKNVLAGMDFNPTFFSHENAADGFTLSHKDKAIRDYWISHGIACRKIAGEMGKQFGTTTVTNFWIPDGYKDNPVDRAAPRKRLAESLDKIFENDIDPNFNLDAVESKLFGIGAESYTVGSHEFYMGYSISRGKLLCLDAGHFHPTEMISDKISSCLMFTPGLLLHVSRPVRWDSDHVVILDDELQRIAHEIVNSGQMDKIHIGLDFFDASINRIAAWVTGTRAMVKALMMALLYPYQSMKDAELQGDYTTRLAMGEVCKTMPFSAVWDYYCQTKNVPVGSQWIDDVKTYEKNVLSTR